MRLMSFGTCSVELSLSRDLWPTLAGFVHRATTDAPAGVADMELLVTSGPTASLVIGERADCAVLIVPPQVLRSSNEPVLKVAVLQAAARCLSLRTAATGAVLLHGSAVTVGAHGPGIAVLDGGSGQGKTSLAMGLAQAGGALVVDEFLFVEDEQDTLTSCPAPHLPWHIRPDMRCQLAPDQADHDLLFPDEITDARCARSCIDLQAVLIPDMGRRAGNVRRIEPTTARRLLQRAVTDHQAKLVNPRLDHVSLFSSPGQVTSETGVPLATYHQDDRPGLRALEVLCRLPAFLVGIETPDELARSVRAAHHALASIGWAQ